MQLSKKNYPVKVRGTKVLVWWEKKKLKLFKVLMCHRGLSAIDVSGGTSLGLDRSSPLPTEHQTLLLWAIDRARGGGGGCILPGHSADASATVWRDARGASVTVYQKPDGRRRGLGEGLPKIAIQRGLVNGGSSAGPAWKAISHVSSIIHAVSVSTLARLGM